MAEDVKKQIDELEKKLKYHAKLYYEQDKNEISDYEYDKLNSELKELYKKYPQYLTPDSITQKVGGEVKKGFKKINHKVAMQSLQDVFDYSEIRDFYDKIEKEAQLNNIENVEFVVETKIDGLSASVKYIDGEYVLGATRGNGLIGEDVTQNIETIKTLPKKIDHNGEILLRGEVFISKKDFEELNEKQKEQGKELFANARNAAAGSLRQLKTSEVQNRNLDMYIFNVQEDNQKMFNSHYAYLEYLEKQGFNVIPYRYLCKDYDQIIQAVEKIHELRESLGFGIDGAVIKVDNLEFRQILGVTAKTPRWAIAFKYPPEEKQTKVLDIIFTVGKTGKITPNAILEPVEVDGSVISKVSLHNEDILKQKDVRRGDTAIIHKAGDVIPELVKVVKEKRDGTEEIVEMPKNCPVCNAPTHREEGMADTKCTSLECPAKLQRTIEYFASRDAMNILGLGESIISMLLEKGMIQDVSDLYKLTIEDFKSLKKTDGTKFATNLYNSIQSSKTNDLSRLINALGIPNVGTTVAKILAKNFKTIENLENASVEDLLKINEIGNIMANEVYTFFRTPQNIELLNKLESYGVNTKYLESDEKLSSDKLENLTFVITGTFEEMGRKEIAEMIEQNGGKVSSSVSKKTSYLVCGTSPGSKLEKAKDLGVEVIDLKQLEQKING